MKASTQSSNEAHTSDLRSAPARPGICAAEARRNIWSVLETPLERFTAALLAAGDLLLSESELLSGILGYGYRARKRLARASRPGGQHYRRDHPGDALFHHLPEAA